MAKKTRTTRGKRKTGGSATARKKTGKKTGPAGKTSKKRSGGAGSSTASRRSTGALDPEAGEVIVRMYQQGLGDCFLLSFPGRSKPCHVLIDCGVLLGTTDAEEKMERVAKSIHEATGGHLDLLVATHEHWDHLSGFLQARGEFDKFDVDQLWLAWTDDPGDELANTLRRERNARKRNLRSAVTRLASLDKDRADGIDQLLGFFGAGSLGAGKGNTTEDALKYLKGRDDTKKSTEFCTPGGKPRSLPGAEGVNVYVLGPPQDRKKIKRSDPTKRGKEVYEFGLAAAQEAAFFAAVDDTGQPSSTLTESDAQRRRRGFPFDERYCVTTKEARAAFDGFFARHYGFDKKADSGDAWRRIDADWLGLAGPLALKLDSDTNNTSLALAFELPHSGKVLLFPGDAQVGNWLSWHDYTWHRNGGKTVNAKDLLARTVLYKVGHHASHNATLRDLGLELMTDPDLAAMIPVNQDMAERKRWKMPFPSLLKRLIERTQGRVLRADETWRGTREPKPADMTKAAWNRFVRSVRSEADLYVQITIPDA